MSLSPSHGCVWITWWSLDSGRQAGNLTVLLSLPPDHLPNVLALLCFACQCYTPACLLVPCSLARSLARWCSRSLIPRNWTVFGNPRTFPTYQTTNFSGFFEFSKIINVWLLVTFSDCSDLRATWSWSLTSAGSLHSGTQKWSISYQATGTARFMRTKTAALI